jgi:uncharacterized protein (DUF1499 family)
MDCADYRRPACRLVHRCSDGLAHRQATTASWRHRSSTATTDYHRIAPLSGGTNAKASFERLRSVVAAMPGATIVVDQPEYLYAEFQSRIWHFVDDVEFLLDEPGGVIEVRSASRLGRKDFGVNRARIESIRAALTR